MKGRDVAVDLLVLPLLVVIHCAVVFALLCLYLYGLDYVTYAPTIGEQHILRSVAFLLDFGVPFGLAIVAAWFNFRFILGKIARTESARAIGAMAIFIFAVAIPVFMIPVDLVIGCMVTSEKVGKPICL